MNKFVKNYSCFVFYNNYIRVYGKQVTIKERYSSQNCEHCQDPEGEQYWFVDQIIYHNNWWEVFP